MGSDLSAYLERHPDLGRQRSLAAHYTDVRRQALAVEAEEYRLVFGLLAPGVGVHRLEHPHRPLNVLAAEATSLEIAIWDGEGREYRTAAPRSPARINVFRHGPHYWDVHVFDLVPTAEDGACLPVRGEAVLHCYPDRLYVQVRLHVTEPLTPRRAEVRWYLEPGEYRRWGSGTDAGELVAGVRGGTGPVRDGSWLGVTGGQWPAVGWILGRAEGTEALEVERRTGSLVVCQRLALTDPWQAGSRPTVGCRVVLVPTGALSEIASLAEEEACPLGPERFRVLQGGRFLGYDAWRGHYTVEPDGELRLPHSDALYFHDHPQEYGRVDLELAGDERARWIYVKHQDRRVSRLEAGVLTDRDGQALPILVQGSKNFCGENEEPFYDPGDPPYAESYFPLALEPGDTLRLRSYHARQNWGNHPLKQVSSLQAWMPYYQMSVGVTETTCYVPTFFPGHGGIWIADLRGLSGTRWSHQPQFDNVGGHRFVHYRTASGEHAARFLRSRFRLTGPNMCRWGMDYVTDGEEARIRLDIFEFPQTDQTRDFVKLRVDFDRELVVPQPAENLFVVSLDTTVQRLRYGTIGYWDADDHLAECPADPAGPLPVGVPLGLEAPFVALYRCLPTSGQRGNNALIVRHFSGLCGGRPLERLALTAQARPGGNLLVGITLAVGAVAHFRPGDHLEVDLLILPYGTVHGGPEVPIEERLHFGLRAPSVTIHRGRLLESFPLRIAVDREQQAEFLLHGGYSTIGVLLEGFADYRPPVLEVLRSGERWEEVELCAGGTEGHHVYRCGDGRYGFVFLVGTDGSTLSLRVHPR